MRAPLYLIRLGTGAAALLVATTAAATGGVGGKGDTGGKGGNGPASPSSDTSSTSDTSQTPATDTSEQQFGGASTQYRDVTEKRPQEKPWQVVGTFETHRLVQDNYLTEGVGKVKLFNVLAVAGYYYVTPDDRITLDAAAFQYFLADSGESGFRADDVQLEYSHLFRLPSELKLRASAGATVPISFDSQLASNITSPFARLRLTRVFGDLTVSVGVSGRAFIDRYSTSASLGAAGLDSGSGQPNPQWQVRAGLTAEFQLPFYRPLAFGVSVVDSYVWYYSVGTCPYDTMCYGATSDPQFGNGQPVQQSYGGELYLRYALPELSGFKSNVVLALANGDPSLGYPSVLNDGIQHPYFFYYDTAEVYVALEGAY